MDRVRITRTLAETFELGRQIGQRLQAGDILSLSGPLGAGKTQLAHGITHGFLGEEVPTNSPSYTIANRYQVGELCVYHIDLYRLEDLEDLESTGYWEMLEDPEAIVIIEWLDRIAGAQPLDYLEFRLSVVEAEAAADGEDRQHRRIACPDDSRFAELCHD